MTLSDLFMGVGSITLAGIFAYHGYFPFVYARWCTMWIGLTTYLGTASLYNLACMSVDRLMACIQPIQHKAAGSKLRVILLVAIFWIIPLIVSLVPFAVYDNISGELEPVLWSSRAMLPSTYNFCRISHSVQRDRYHWCVRSSCDCFMSLLANGHWTFEGSDLGYLWTTSTKSGKVTTQIYLSSLTYSIQTMSKTLSLVFGCCHSSNSIAFSWLQTV